MSAKVTKDQEAVWVQFASSALAGLLASGNWQDQAAEKAADHADKLLKELESRNRLAGGK
ncbi:hypothetical protein [Pseudomonas coronafaciens]|uniref:hypothetical protein n=1 Tax=Pseudomonas coronafaciens TaxID=53409 RepID=UPI000F00048F|nr:hypothetical protein [Pseudomonas coronafaciens]